MTRVKGDYHIVTALSILMFAYSIQFMVFPTYVELEKRSSERYAWSSIWATVMYSVAFLMVSICGLLLFGSKLRADFLQNIATKDGSISIFLRTTYCIVLLFHIPYFFFSIKEYSLVIFDEIVNRSLSTHLEAKLSDFYKEKEEAKAAKDAER